MSTPEAEYKETLMRAVERMVGYLAARQGAHAQTQTMGALPMTVGGYQDQGFGTGYDTGTGETVVAFTTDISYPDGPDRLVD